MKKILVVLFLSLTMISFTKSFYGKEESLPTIYNEMQIKRPKLSGKTAQNIADDFTRIIYELLSDLSVAPREEHQELSDYYNDKLAAFMSETEKKQHQVSKKDGEILFEHINQLSEIINQFQWLWKY